MIEYKSVKFCAHNYIDELYSFALSIPEFKISSQIDFMSKEELYNAMITDSTIMYVAKDNDKIVGFIYFTSEDLERSFNGQACLVYIAVDSKYRKQGIATELYNKSIEEVKKRGLKYVFVWADIHGGIVYFLEKMGYSIGKEHILMDKKV